MLIPTNDTHISRKHTFNEWLQGVMSIPKLAGSYEVNYLLSYKEHIRLAQNIFFKIYLIRIFVLSLIYL